MTTIHLPDTGRVLVADAKRMIRDAAPRETFIEIHAETDERGDLVPGGRVETVRVESSAFGPWFDEEFVEACKRMGIAPRMKWRPSLQRYEGGELHDLSYTIAHDEFVRLVEAFGIAVEDGKPAAPAGAPVQDSMSLPCDPLPRWMTLEKAAAALHAKTGRPWASEQIVECAARRRITIWAPIDRSARFVRVAPIEGQSNEINVESGSVGCALRRRRLMPCCWPVKPRCWAGCGRARWTYLQASR